jgi:hypothetical protein
MTEKPFGRLIYPNAGEPVFSGTTIGRELSPEHKQIIDRIRAAQLRRIEERRKRRP